MFIIIIISEQRTERLRSAQRVGATPHALQVKRSRRRINGPLPCYLYSDRTPSCQPGVDWRRRHQLHTWNQRDKSARGASLQKETGREVTASFDPTTSNPFICLCLQVFLRLRRRCDSRKEELRRVVGDDMLMLRERENTLAALGRASGAPRRTQPAVGVTMRQFSRRSALKPGGPLARHAKLI